ncbi:RNA methyltransferase [Maricaulis sp. W15]|uniref:THUMP domain-containing class I SAM-dependent RNA methyltransferase n=1 Tax=Maricaulis sp. W15 TaxID=1772333 RepID=UPI0009490847|nr:RNA methyltransferase [Maricaulis sp. W15]OLF75534.1 RNA methyltransferase [Maricaulis sp. W15]
MTRETDFEIFLAVVPGLEPTLCAELSEKGFAAPRPEPGGVTIQGGWPDVWRANLEIRGASRILARIDAFRVVHLSQLDKLAHRVDWKGLLRPDVPVRVEASCRRSKIYHAGAAAERVSKAIEAICGAPVNDEAALCVRVRIEDNLCTLSVDTSGELLHRRGFKAEVNKAPMRETLAALFLREAGFDGVEPVLDPMCGSGTFVIEAAEMGAGLLPGRGRAFAFELLAGFDAQAWCMMKAERIEQAAIARSETRCFGSDRDAGAIRMSRTNAERAGVAAMTAFDITPVMELSCPAGAPGLVIANPPYGARIGNKKSLYAVYGALGDALRMRFSGWRAAIVTTDPALARATRLPFGPPGRPVDHGGLKIRLYTTGPLR